MKNYDEKFSSIIVLGAAGKMGSGILLCLLEYFARRFLSENKLSIRPAILAVDLSDEVLRGLISFLRAHLTKFAERNIVRLRAAYTDNEELVENSEHIDFFVREMLSHVAVSTKIHAAADSALVFEATPENPDLKISLFSDILKKSTVSPWILSNTSSIPISELDKKSELHGNIIGFHFYNPPAVQKLLELIPSENGSRELYEFSRWIAAELGKKTVEVKDVAGFAGNGVFVREISYALDKVAALSSETSWEKGIFMLDVVTRDYLVRPMGIFQLIDYVGLDVCVSIAEIMQERLHEEINVEKLKELISMGIVGGQYPNGAQKDGIFRYEKNRPVAVYDVAAHDYRPFNEIESELIGELGKKNDFPRWKILRRDKGATGKLANHFRTLFTGQSKGAQLAKEYLEFYRSLGSKLLEQHVVGSTEDLNLVMMLGFQHLYGPFNDFV